MNKKMLHFLLFCLSCLFILISCSKKKLISDSTPLTFSMLYNETEASLLQEDWLILKEYESRKNVVFDIQVADNSRYENAINVALKTVSPPDIILKVWPQNILEFANNGYLLPVSDYYDQMPYFQAYIKSNNLEDELDKLKMENGKYYLFPGFKRKTQVQQWIYRKDVFDENSLEIPKTYEELFDSLSILKKKYPNTTPISATWGGAHLFAMIGASFGINAGWRGNQFFDTKTNKWLFAPATDNYKEMYKFLNRCYREGILDPDFLTLSENDFYDKIQDGRVLVTPTWITSGFNNWNEQLKKHGYPNGEWAPLPVPESPIGLRALPSVDSYKKGIALSSLAKNKPYFKELLQFIDWAMYSEEGQTLTYWGVEGITFTETSEGKAFLQSISTPKNPEGTVNAKKEYGLETFFDNVENEELADYKKQPEIVSFLEQSLKNHEVAESPPPLIIGEESLKAINILSTPLNLYVTETSNKFITGEIDIETYWDQYLIELNKKGYKTLENIWNSTEKKDL